MEQGKIACPNCGHEFEISDALSGRIREHLRGELLMAISRERNASVGNNEKMEALYQYLAGVEFKQKIEGIVEAFTSAEPA